MTPELLGEVLGLLMFAGACGLLILGYPVALTLAAAGRLPPHGFPKSNRFG